MDLYRLSCQNNDFSAHFCDVFSFLGCAIFTLKQFWIRIFSCIPYIYMDMHFELIEIFIFIWTETEKKRAN